MAKYGANHPCFQAGSNPGIVIGKLVSANLTIQLATGELYADDEQAEYVSEFSSGTIAMETDDMSDQAAANVYGCKVEGGVVTYNKGDTAPNGKLAYYKACMKNKQKYYQGYFYPSVQASLGNDNAQTKGSSITFQTTQTSFNVSVDENGDWRKTERFETEAAAKAWVENMTGVANYFEIDISTNGAAETDGAQPNGKAYVAAGESLTITITGTPTAIYDNGEEKISALSGGAYTITGINEKHDVTIIY